MIKPRYNQNRIGATVFTAVAATTEDETFWNQVIYHNKGKALTYKTYLDARVVAGKLLAHPEFSKLIKTNENTFTFVVDLLHPKNKRRLYIGGHDVYVYVVYEKRTSKEILKKVETWLKSTLVGIDPLNSQFKFGTRYKYGIAENDKGILMLTHQKTSRPLEYSRPYEDWRIGE